MKNKKRDESSERFYANHQKVWNGSLKVNKHLFSWKGPAAATFMYTKSWIKFFIGLGFLTPKFKTNIDLWDIGFVFKLKPDTIKIGLKQIYIPTWLLSAFLRKFFPLMYLSRLLMSFFLKKVNTMSKNPVGILS